MIEIIEGDLSHIPVIQKIATVTWPSTFENILSATQISYMLNLMYSENSLKEQMTKQNHIFLLAKRGIDFLGFSSYEINFKNSLKTKIHKIYILPNAQGFGIGKLFLNTIENTAISSKNSFLSLNVNKYNHAISFYEKIGFYKTGSEVIDIGNNYIMDDYIMEKTIG